MFSFVYVSFVCFEIWAHVAYQPQTHMVAKDNFELLIFLPQLTDSWSDRCELFCPLYEMIEIE